MLSRTSLMAFVAVAALAGVMTGCGQPADNDAELAGAEADGVESGTAVLEAYVIAVVPKGLTHQFWLTVKSGAEAAAEEHDAEIMWNGPAQETDVAQQISIIEDMLNGGADALVLAATDQNALVDVVERIVEGGTPVVTIDSGVQSDAPASFIATDNVAGARQAAEVMAELIEGDGEVGVIPFVPGAATSEMRERGFGEGIDEYADIEIVATLYSQSDVAQGMSAAEDMLTANPDLDGIFAANEAGALGAVQALKASGKAGQVKLVAFDAADSQIEALRDGVIDALIVQNPFQMGYKGVETAIEVLQGEEVSERIDTGVAVVTRDNLDDPEIQKLLNPL